MVIFDTPELQERGLQWKRAIEDDTLFVFPMVAPGVQFHSRNVPEPFDLAFFTDEFEVIGRLTVVPPLGTAIAPARTYGAIESKAGNLARWGFDRGRRIPL